MMKKANRLVAFFMSAIILVGSIGMNVSAAENGSNELQGYNYSVGGLRIVTNYEINSEMIVEESKVFKDAQEILTISKEVSLNGTIRVFQNEILVKTGIGDYERFLAAAQGKLESITHNEGIELASTIYYACGRTEYHEYVSKSTETINIGVQTSVENGIIVLLTQLLLPNSVIILIAAPIANTAKQVDAEYVDITDTKYFIYNNAAQISMNCYHLYIVYYDTVGGNKSVVKTEWKFHQEIL